MGRFRFGGFDGDLSIVLDWRTVSMVNFAGIGLGVSGGWTAAIGHLFRMGDDIVTRYRSSAMTK